MSATENIGKKLGSSLIGVTSAVAGGALLGPAAVAGVSALSIAAPVGAVAVGGMLIGGAVSGVLGLELGDRILNTPSSLSATSRVALGAGAAAVFATMTALSPAVTMLGVPLAVTAMEQVSETWAAVTQPSTSPAR